MLLSSADCDGWRGTHERPSAAPSPVHPSSCARSGERHRHHGSGAFAVSLGAKCAYGDTPIQPFFGEGHPSASGIIATTSLFIVIRLLRSCAFGRGEDSESYALGRLRSSLIPTDPPVWRAGSASSAP